MRVDFPLTFPPPSGSPHLLPLLERCTRELQSVPRYKEDQRYLRVWVLYANCVTEPGDIFKFLEANAIGQSFALFHEAHATFLELRGSFNKARNGEICDHCFSLKNVPISFSNELRTELFQTPIGSLTSFTCH